MAEAQRATNQPGLDYKDHRDQGERREQPRDRQIDHLTKRVLTLDEFCQQFGIGRTLAYRQIRLKRLAVKKIGRRTLIARDEAERWFQSL